VYCRQTAGWIKMPLGTEVDLSLGHIVLGGTQLSSRKGHSSPPSLLFSADAYCGQMVAHLSYSWALVDKSCIVF